MTSSVAGFTLLPNDALLHVLKLAPETALVLRTTSRALLQIAGEFLEGNKEEIFRLLTRPGGVHPLLDRCIHNNYVQCTFRLSLIPGDQALSFHVAVRKEMKELGASPSAVLSPQEICQFNDGIPDLNLQKAWGPLREAFYRHHFDDRALLDAELPGTEATAQEIRNGIQTQQLRLQRIPTLLLGELRLTSVPTEIGRCTGLRQLSLCQNQLVTLPEALLREMTQLQWLYLAFNQLDSLPVGLFRGMNQLQNLFLQNNQLASFPEGLFQELPQLEGVHLSGNRITFLPEGTFRGLTQLRSLELSDNRLTSLPEWVCRELPQLEELKLRNNQLVSLPESLSHGLPQLSWLALSGNPALFLSCRDFPLQNNIQFIETMREFFTYRCRSALAGLYQLVAQGASPDIAGALAGLDSTLKNAIFRKVWEEADRPLTGDPKWGEHHVLEDMLIFQRALKKCVMERFKPLEREYWKRVSIYGVADPYHNILKAIDAMMGV